MIADVLLALAVLAIALLVWGRREPFAAAPAIVGGIPADYKRYPWFCSFFEGTPNKPRCGGALIAPDVVLTAKHCAIVMSPSMRVIVGNTVVRKPVKFAAHPTYDVMMVWLDRPVEIKPIKLAKRMPKNATPVTLLGRGLKTGDTTVKHDPAFTLARPYYFENAPMLKLLQREPAFTKEAGAIESVQRGFRTLNVGATAFQQPRQGCSGDSGGPVIIEKGYGPDELVGIMSSGHPTCELDTKLSYTFFVKVPTLDLKKIAALAVSDPIEIITSMIDLPTQ